MKEKPDYRYELRLQEITASKPGDPVPLPSLFEPAAGQVLREQGTAAADTAAIPEYRH